MSEWFEIYYKFFGGKLQWLITKAFPRSSSLNTTLQSCKTEINWLISITTTASWLTEDKPSEELKRFLKRLNLSDSKRSLTALTTKTFNQDQFKEAFWFSFQDLLLWTMPTSLNFLKFSTFAPTAKEDFTATTISSPSLFDHDLIVNLLS